jgi:hypothetical protein
MRLGSPIAALAAARSRDPRRARVVRERVASGVLVRSLRLARAGKDFVMNKWRYALLGWVTWVVGKRVARRKIRKAIPGL